MNGFAAVPPIPLVESYNSCSLTLWQALFSSAGNGMSIAGNAATLLICLTGFFTREIYLKLLNRKTRKVAVDGDLTGGERGAEHGGVEMTDQQAGKSSAGGGGGGGAPSTADDRTLLQQVLRELDDERNRVQRLEALVEQLQAAAPHTVLA